MHVHFHTHGGSRHVHAHDAGGGHAHSNLDLPPANLPPPRIAQGLDEKSSPVYARTRGGGSRVGARPQGVAKNG